jgi:phosphohistidine phosphatase
MVVYIARHAWAGERGDPRWADDSLRELTPDGIERYRKVLKALAGRGFRPERIATSPYVRCRQTADLIAEQVAGKAAVEELEALAPGSEIEPLVAWSRAQGDCDTCWVGHSPDVERLAAELIGDGTALIRFAKGAIAAISFEEEVRLGGGTLCWLVTAKSLGF